MKPNQDPEMADPEFEDILAAAASDLPLLEKKHPRQLSWVLPGPLSRPSSDENRKKWLHRVGTVARWTALLVLATLGVVSVGQRIYKLFQPIPAVYQICQCGNSTAEALANGCKFDLLGPSWAPDHCRDDELTAEFMKAGTGPNGTWQFWWDHDHKQPMSIEEVSLLPDIPGGAFYSEWEFHVKHCTYQWRKQWRNIVERGKSNSDVENVGLGHIQHCEGVILRQKPVRAEIPLNVPYIGWKPSHDTDDLHTAPDDHHGGSAM